MAFSRRKMENEWESVVDPRVIEERNVLSAFFVIGKDYDFFEKLVGTDHLHRDQSVTLGYVRHKFWFLYLRVHALDDRTKGLMRAIRSIQKLEVVAIWTVEAQETVTVDLASSFVRLVEINDAMGKRIKGVTLMLKRPGRSLEIHGTKCLPIGTLAPAFGLSRHYLQTNRIILDCWGYWFTTRNERENPNVYKFHPSTVRRHIFGNMVASAHTIRLLDARGGLLPKSVLCRDRNFIRESELRIESVLDSPGSGFDLCEGRWTDGTDASRVVVKKFRLESLSGRRRRKLERLERHIRILISSHHKNFLKVHGFLTRDEGEIWIIFESERCDLASYRAALGENNFSADDYVKIFYQIADGMEHIHRNGLAHWYFIRLCL
ncbi:MAG: protein kinase family protein [Candidatus Latescibacterota bacterium]|nr:MAG: protein kinase family protein [Candidatus Latescibacterota bacterium]